ncbi:hypothetical protein [Aminobacter sp. AP02]|uniref:hypothetical protein n=1 Tax=Aminobacter sp. AP02 TaxID=2135737 RepID=UPI0011B20113|nr:hypothetical protein [Aminobacter sp. AP02]
MAGTPLEAVRPFYDHVGLELDPAERGRFVDPAKAVLDARHQLVKSGQGDCLDTNMPLDSAAYDKAELDKSLKLNEAESGESAIVVATFMALGEPHRMQWKLKKVDGEWKIADFLSVTNEWAFSLYQCE